MCSVGDCVHGLGVQRSYEPLEACGKQRCVGVVQLLRQESPTRLHSAYRPMRVLDLVERRPRISLPFDE